MKLCIRDQRRGSEPSRSLCRLAGKKMALVPAPPLDLPGSGHLESLFRSSVCFQFRHSVTLLFSRT
jgi:hypothetical protein